MIQDLIRDLSRIAGGLGAIEADTIAIFNKRDRASGPRVISEASSQQVAEEVMALSKFLSHFLISQDKDVSSVLRWVCYKVGHNARYAAGIVDSIKRGKSVISCKNHLREIQDLLRLVDVFDQSHAPDFTGPRDPLSLLSQKDCSLLAAQTIHSALYDLDDSLTTQLFQKLASNGSFEPIILSGSSAQTIKPPRYLGDAVMVALCGSRSIRYSIQIIDMIKVLALYSHFVRCFLYCGDFLRSQVYALDRVNHVIEPMEKRYCVEEEHSEVSSPEYEAMCKSALHYFDRCVRKPNPDISASDVLNKVNAHLLDAARKIERIIKKSGPILQITHSMLSKTGIESLRQRVTIMNKFFEAVDGFIIIQDCTMPDYLAIPGSSLANTQAFESDEALDMRGSTLEGAQASASYEALDAGPSKRPRLL